MSAAAFSLGLDVRLAERVELFVCDLSLARALYEGSPAARLLARTRLASDERDLAPGARGNAKEAPTSTWDEIVRSITQDDRPLLERIKRAVARHTRAASVEGPLAAAVSVIAGLVAAVAMSEDVDASLAEIGGGSARVARSTSDLFALRCAAYDTRLGSPTADLRGTLFEACVRLSARRSLGPASRDVVLAAFSMLSEIHAGESLPRRLPTLLFPRDFDIDIANSDRRVALIDRAALDAIVARDPRDLAAAISRCDHVHRASSPHASTDPTAHLDTFVADLTKLLASPGPLALALSLAPASPVSPYEDPPSVRSTSHPSWIPESWASSESAAALAESLERGTTTLPRVRLAVARGGDPALDAVGGEMLRAALHPFASAAFAEILARSGRPRDIVRLVTYFAVAPDPALAARALSACAAPELPRVLAAWLEAMLPSDGELAPLGDDPDTSSAARLTACISSLSPYPHLHGAVAPLMRRVSEAPSPFPPSG